MKNSNEMMNSLLERRDRYEVERAQKRTRLTHTLTPIGCICLVALLGVGAWQSGIFETQPSQTLNDAVIPGIKDWYGPGEEEPPLKANPEKKEVVSSYGGGVNASYATPENGEFSFSIPLNNAMEAYGNAVDYRVVIDVFSEGALQSVESETVNGEMKRLIECGYDCERIEGVPYLVVTADLYQLKEFAAAKNHGYFMFLYGEKNR